MGRHYRSDFYGWTQDQADALRRRSVNEIDWDNLLEEIEDLAASTRRELRSRLSVIIHHLIKWRHQPGRRSKSWAVTIAEQRNQVNDLLEDNPSIAGHLDQLMAKANRAGLNGAVAEMGVPEELLLIDGPYTYEDVMTVAIEWEQD